MGCAKQLAAGWMSVCLTFITVNTTTQLEKQAGAVEQGLNHVLLEPVNVSKEDIYT